MRQAGLCSDSFILSGAHVIHIFVFFFSTFEYFGGLCNCLNIFSEAISILIKRTSIPEVDWLVLSSLSPLSHFFQQNSPIFY